MELEEQQYAEYAKGFNHASIVAEHDPNLLEAITSGVNTDDIYFKGFFAGKAQWLEEQELQKLADLREQHTEREREQNIPQR